MHVVSRESPFLPSTRNFSDSALEPGKKKKGKGGLTPRDPGPEREEKTEAHGGDDGG